MARSKPSFIDRSSGPSELAAIIPLMPTLAEQALELAAHLEREAARHLRNGAHSTMTDDAERFWFGETRAEMAARERRQAEAARGAARDLARAGL